MSTAVAADQVGAVREFNRYYTRQIGLLQEGLLKSPFSLTQARVLFEIASRKQPTAREIGTSLDLDAGYLSRILQDFVAQGILAREQDSDDARRYGLSLTATGRKAFRGIDQASAKATARMLSRLPLRRRERLLDAMRQIRETLDTGVGEHSAGIALRAPRAGDIGWAIERHGSLYAAEYGWSLDFEALVAGLFARFATRHDPQRERLWIAELENERAGCVFVVANADDAQAAQLRCLLVDPSARGHGIGTRLINECIAFARSAGYARILLWTNDVLIAARRLYEAAGFSLVEQGRHDNFGKDLVGQVWARDL